MYIKEKGQESTSHVFSVNSLDWIKRENFRGLRISSDGGYSVNNRAQRYPFKCCHQCWIVLCMHQRSERRKASNRAQANSNVQLTSTAELKSTRPSL